MNKEEHRLAVLQALLESRLSVAEAARALHLTARQVYRLQAIARTEGLRHVLHRGRGRTPVNKIPAETWSRILNLAHGPYRDLNDYEMQEALAREHDIHVSRESLRKRLRAEGIAPKGCRNPEAPLKNGPQESRDAPPNSPISHRAARP